MSRVEERLAVKWAEEPCRPRATPSETARWWLNAIADEVEKEGVRRHRQQTATRIIAMATVAKWLRERAGAQEKP